jgi:hypothetical protein
MTAIAAEFSEALGRKITNVDVPFDQWRREFAEMGLPDHVFQHLTTMARLHADNRYDRATTDVQQILGRPPSGVAEYVERNPDLFRT